MFGWIDHEMLFKYNAVNFQNIAYSFSYQIKSIWNTAIVTSRKSIITTSITSTTTSTSFSNINIGTTTVKQLQNNIKTTSKSDEYFVLGLFNDNFRYKRTTTSKNGECFAFELYSYLYDQNY